MTGVKIMYKSIYHGILVKKQTDGDLSCREPNTLLKLIADAFQSLLFNRTLINDQILDIVKELYNIQEY